MFDNAPPADHEHDSQNGGAAGQVDDHGAASPSATDVKQQVHFPEMQDVRARSQKLRGELHGRAIRQAENRTARRRSTRRASRRPSRSRAIEG
jgi:hypothetical protein